MKGMLQQLLLRFVIGGLVVSAFAVIGDLLRPKRFAGLFGAAPSVALATLALTVHHDGAPFAALEARSMIAGSAAFLVCAAATFWLLQRSKMHALAAASAALVLWFAVALGAWELWLR